MFSIPKGGQVLTPPQSPDYTLTLGCETKITSAFNNLTSQIAASALKDASTFTQALPPEQARRAVACLSVLSDAFSLQYFDGIFTGLPLNNAASKELARLVEADSFGDLRSQVITAALGLMIEVGKDGSIGFNHEKSECWAGFSALSAVSKLDQPTIDSVGAVMQSIARSNCFNSPLLIAVYSTTLKLKEQLKPEVVKAVQERAGYEALYFINHPDEQNSDFRVISLEQKRLGGEILRLTP
jgi:hypothetical protein